VAWSYEIPLDSTLGAEGGGVGGAGVGVVGGGRGGWGGGGGGGGGEWGWGRESRLSAARACVSAMARVRRSKEGDSPLILEGFRSGVRLASKWLPPAREHYLLLTFATRCLFMTSYFVLSSSTPRERERERERAHAPLSLSLSLSLSLE